MVRFDRGFTLIELIVVVIIIGILASIGEVIMSDMQKRAIASEAVVTLGAIRTAERVYYSEHGNYTVSLDELNINADDLTGTYFGKECYSMRLVLDPPMTSSSLFFFCYPIKYPTSAPKASVVQNWPFVAPFSYIAMDRDGNIYSNIPGLGFPPTNEMI